MWKPYPIIFYQAIIIWACTTHSLGRRVTKKKKKKKRLRKTRVKTDDGDEVTEPDSISNAFNDFFVNIGPKRASTIKHSRKDYFEYLLNPTQKIGS